MYIKSDYHRFSRRDNYSYLISEARNNLWEYFSAHPSSQHLQADYSSPEVFSKSSDISCIHDMYTLFCSLGEATHDEPKTNEAIFKNTSLLCDLLNMKGSETEFVRREINDCIRENPPDNSNFFSFSESGNQLQAVNDIGNRQLFVDVFPSSDTASYQYVSNLLRQQKEETGASTKTARMDKIMEYMRYALESGHDVSPLKKTYQDMNKTQFREVLKGVLSGIDVSAYNNPSLSAKQMREIRNEISSSNRTSIPQDKEKKRLFVDMDGTLAKWEDVPYFERLLEEGYFLERPPIESVVDAVHTIIKEHPEIEVCILSSCLKESQYAEAEKNAWLDKYLPEIDNEHRFFPAFGEDKASVLEGGIRENDFLLDDYSQNLFLFEPPATGIKLLNGINHTHESWRKNALSFDKSGKELADDIFAIMDLNIQIRDKKPQDRKTDIIRTLPDKEASQNKNPIKTATQTKSVISRNPNQDIEQS